MIATRQRRAALAGTFLVLGLVLFLLIASLDRAEFSPGIVRAFPFQAERTRQADSPDGGPQLGPEIAHRVGLLVLFVSVVVLFVAALFSSTARRRLFSLCLFALILLLVWWLWVSRLVPTAEAPSGGPGAADLPLDAIGPAEGSPLEDLPDRTPSLLVTFAALGAALALSALAAVLLTVVLPRLRRRTSASLLSDLAERAHVAAQRIREGEDPRSVVLACYREMSALLTRVHRVPGAAFLTAREFAALLEGAGMSAAHVARLTAIFEEVRYGWREGNGLAEEAIGCLDTIRTTYAAGVP